MWVRRNYLFRLVFESGFRTNLGYHNNKLFKNWPCLITLTGNINGDNMRCDVHTGGGH